MFFKEVFSCEKGAFNLWAGYSHSPTFWFLTVNWTVWVSASRVVSVDQTLNSSAYILYLSPSPISLIRSCIKMKSMGLWGTEPWDTPLLTSLISDVVHLLWFIWLYSAGKHLWISAYWLLSQSSYTATSMMWWNYVVNWLKVNHDNSMSLNPKVLKVWLKSCPSLNRLSKFFVICMILSMIWSQMGSHQAVVYVLVTM